MVDRVQGGSPNHGMRSYPASQPLTDKQKSEVLAILSKNDPKSLPFTDAQTILEAFREVNLRPGREPRRQ